MKLFNMLCFLRLQSLKDELRDLASQSPDKSNPHYEVCKLFKEVSTCTASNTS